jgi:hypothetical protein
MALAIGLWAANASRKKRNAGVSESFAALTFRADERARQSTVMDGPAQSCWGGL